MCGKWYSLAVDIQYDVLWTIGEKVKRITRWDKKDPNWPMEGAEFEMVDGGIRLLLFKDEVREI